ncbi:MAG TPA: glycosyltransferase [Mycobacteriales bacterium]|nr:glycosyltransferase [Mycobacteriales bacterium]
MIVLCGLSALIWLWLLCFRGGFWRTWQRLPERSAPSHWPSVGIVVPARDEADVLPETLESLLCQDYPGPVGIVVVDDGSTDGTGDIARSLSGGIPVTVIEAGPPPAGWSGKLWAVQRGVEEFPDREFLLFTDADIRHAQDSLTSLVESAVTGDYALVSQMARLRAKSFWERQIVPAFVYFFGMLYPFRWINKPNSRTAAAAGGCVLLRREVLVAAGGIAAIHQAIIDDVALGRLIKRSGGRIWLGLAERVESIRAYPDLGGLWRMVARSAYAQLRYSPILLAGTVLGLLVMFVAPPAGLIAGTATGDGSVALVGGLSWLLMAMMYVPMLRYYRQPVLRAPLLPLVALLYAAMTVDSARGSGTAWKGRADPARR